MSSLCRFCAAPLEHVFADLGMSPLANSYLTPEQANVMEPFYPLRAYVCAQCFLVQLEEFETPDHIFSDYAYFSSYSTSWLEHASAYAEQMIERFGLDARARSSSSPPTTGTCSSTSASAAMPVLGIEPAANVAEVAEQKGIPTLVEFFGRDGRAPLAAATRPPTCCSATTSSRTCRISTTSSAG